MNKKISRGSVPKNRHDERRQNMKKKERTHYENLHCPDQTQLFQTQWTVTKYNTEPIQKYITLHGRTYVSY